MIPTHCLFCPETKLTKEDLWPRWIVRLLPADYNHRIAINERVSFKDSNSLTKKFPSVCGTCNNGWMSDIEDETIPVLKPLIMGNYPESLSKQDQRTLALWMSLRSIVFSAYEANNTAEDYYSDSERQTFASLPFPFHQSKLWIAKASGFVSVRSYVNMELNREGFQIITCAIGKVILQMVVRKGNWRSIHGDFDGVPPAWNAGVTQIWPKRFLRRWKTPPLTWDGFELFSKRINVRQRSARTT